jgi:hypothetical protein
MKLTKTQLREIIREELSSVLNEYTSNRFNVETLKPMQPDLFKKLLPKTAKTTKQAEARIKGFQGGKMFTHVQYFEVQPHGNVPNKPTYRLHQLQYWLNDTQLRMMGKDPSQKVNVTRLTIFDTTPVQVGAKETNLGQVFVDTDVFLKEVPVVFNVLKRQS